MPVLRLDDIALSYGTHCLLNNASLTVQEGERIALIGRNGAGKSTLMKLIAGEENPDSGTLWRESGCRFARLEQEIPLASEDTVFDVVAQGLDKVGQWLSEYHHLSTQTLCDDKLKQLEQLQHNIEGADGWSFQQRVDTVLSRLNLPADTRMDALSGGWRRRVALARALVKEPDVLLLDEPTNHLDIVTIDWLEKQLSQYSGVILFITHDRAFMQALATRIVHLDRGELISYECSYLKFVDTREKELEIESRHNALFDKQLAEEERWIRQGIKARRTRNEGRVRALEAMREERARRVSREGTAKLQLDASDRSGKLLVEAENISFAYEQEKIIDRFSTTIIRGDRIGIIGSNGAGKSTLLKILLGVLKPDSGKLTLGTKREIAYFDQDRAQLDVDKSVIDNISEGREFIDVGGKSRHVISYLNDFLFNPERCRTPVRVLSGGECNRLLLAKLFSKPANVLVMDEPTNDLDVETLELLEELLVQFKGTVLLVSHDRVFMDNVVTSSMVIQPNGRIEEHVGGYTAWLAGGGQVRESQRPADAAAQTGSTDESVENVPKKAKPKAAKLSFKLQRELDALPRLIDELETQISALQLQIAEPDFYQGDHAAVAEVLASLNEKEQALEVAFDRWSELEP